MLCFYVDLESVFLILESNILYNKGVDNMKNKNVST